MDAATGAYSRQTLQPILANRHALAGTTKHERGFFCCSQFTNHYSLSFKQPPVLTPEMTQKRPSPQPIAEVPDVIVVDFDKTFIRENLLTAWVFFVLFKSRLQQRKKLLFLFKGFTRGVTSFLLSHHSSWAELAVKIAYGTFRNVPTESLRGFIMNRTGRTGGFTLTLNTELVAVLQRLIGMAQPEASSQPKIVISSQGSSHFAITTFLTRPDVVEALRKAGIGIDPADNRSIVANSQEVINDHFTGRLLPPIITKYNRLHAFPEKALFVGDSKDEWALRTLGKNQVKIRFINYQKML